VLFGLSFQSIRTVSQQILARIPVEFLTQKEVGALLTAPRRISASLGRDLTLFAVMLNAGARVQEICDLRVSDVRLEAPYQIRLRGKCNKVRTGPSWAHTAARLRRLMNRSRGSAEPGQPLFVNRRGERLTRFGMYYPLKKRIEHCSADIDMARERKIHPHVLRHTTAVHLLKAGVDFATISQWLRHASLNTTLNYARADMDVKRQALAQVPPDAPRPPRGGAIAAGNVVEWLRRI
jgi:site-specific recombinase XerD